MAIQTRGFQVSQMPRYTPVDPSLVAFNPTAATEGVMSSLKIKSILEKIAADKALQEELAATRASRIGSQNASANRSIATDTAFTPLAGREAAIRGLQLGQMETLFPAQTGNMLAGLKLGQAEKEAALPNVLPKAALEAGTIASDLSLLGPTNAAKAAELVARKGAAESAEDLRPTGTLVKEAEGLTTLAALEDSDRIRQQRNRVVDAKLALELKSATSQEKAFEATENAKLEKLKAEAAHLKAQANYYNAGGATKAERPETQIAALAMAMKRIEDEYQIPAYEKATYDENGKPRTNLIFPDPKKTPSIEKAIDIRNKYRDTINKVIKKWSDQMVQENDDTDVAPANGSIAPAATGPVYVKDAKGNWVPKQ